MSGFIKQNDVAAHAVDTTSHGTTSDIVGKDDTQTLTNKTINSASNTITITESCVSDLGTYLTDITGESINSLSDVNITTLTDTQLLQYDNGSGKWVNVDANTVGVTDHTALSNIGSTSHADLDIHVGSTSNPHSVTATQVGLGNCDNTSDANKPVSSATQTALDAKQTFTTATVSTTDATPTTLVDIAIASDEEKLITIKVHGHEDATDDHIWKKMEIGAKNVGGTVSLVGGVSASTGYDAGAIAWSIAASASSGNVRITVTGEAAHSIDWRAQIQID